MAINTGRITKVGIGLESVFGTKSSSITWVPWESFAENPQQERVKDDSAIGRIEAPLRNDIVRRWSEPSMTIKAYGETIGILMKTIFGDVLSSGPIDSAYTHDFSVKNDNDPVSLTIVFKDGNRTRMITGAVVNTVNIQMVQNDYIKFDISFIGFAAEDTVDTPSYVAENIFTGAMPIIKLAPTIAGLAGASATCFQEANIEINKNASTEEFFCLGDVSIQEIVNKKFELNGSFTRVMQSEEYQDIFDVGTDQAMSFVIVNTGITIGASTNPAVSFEIAPSSLENYQPSTGIDDIITESWDFVSQYSQDDSKMISSQLVNTTVSY